MKTKELITLFGEFFVFIIFCIINSMSVILETKFHIPQVQANFILRPQLLSLIERNMHGKLTLVTAPAGFGKTTLVTMWLDAIQKGQEKKQIAWVSLDAEDDSLRQF